MNLLMCVFRTHVNGSNFICIFQFNNMIIEYDTKFQKKKKKKKIEYDTNHPAKDLRAKSTFGLVKTQFS